VQKLGAVVAREIQLRPVRQIEQRRAGYGGRVFIVRVAEVFAWSLRSRSVQGWSFVLDRFKRGGLAGTGTRGIQIPGSPGRITSGRGQS
jgi:hypothetical protein